MQFPHWPNKDGYRDIKLGLERVYKLLERLGNPHQKLPPTIHIAGTNGKGSTLAFLRTIYQEAGYLVHCYTSPHLVKFNERIVLANKEIDDDFFKKCLEACKIAASQEPQIEVTFFEGITVAAFLAFSKIKADILLLETGMGGRLDATNVITQNMLSIITPISFDHTEFLGDSLKKIAFEKAGIIKKNCQVIVGKQKLSALDVIALKAKELSCKITIFNQDFSYKKYKKYFTINFENKIYKFLLPSLFGKHQIHNATLAIVAALSAKQFKINHNNIENALQKTFWPARLQKINSGKLFEKLSKNCELFLDGSHNLQGAATVKNFLKDKKNQKKVLIFSMLKDKNCEGFLKIIKNEIDHLIALTIPFEPKSRSKEEILKIAQKLKIKTSLANNFADAIKKTNELNPSLTIISGSLYLAGEFLTNN